MNRRSSIAIGIACIATICILLALWKGRQRAESPSILGGPVGPEHETDLGTAAKLELATPSDVAVHPVPVMQLDDAAKAPTISKPVPRIDTRVADELLAELEQDWDAKLKRSVDELRGMHDSLRQTLSEMTMPTLQAMVDAGMGELVHRDSKVPYKIRKEDITDISYIWSSSGLGTVRVVLPRSGNEAVYELKGKLLALQYAIEHHPSQGGSGG